MKKLIVLAISVAIVNLSVVTAVRAQSVQDARRIEKVRRAVVRIGVDQNANAKLLDGSIVKGRVSEIGNDHFVLVDKKTGDSRILTFAQVNQVRRVEDNPFSDPGVIMGVALVPIILGLVVWAGRQD